MSKEPNPMPEHEEKKQRQTKLEASNGEVTYLLSPGQHRADKTLICCDERGELFRELPSRPIFVRTIEEFTEQFFPATSTDSKQFFTLSQSRLIAELFTPDKMREGISQLRKSLLESEGAGAHLISYDTSSPSGRL